MHADTLRLAKLAEDLLLLARLDERAAGGSAGPDRHLPIDLVSLAQEAAARYAAARVPVAIDVPVPAQMPVAAEVLVPGHRDGLDRLLVNLLDNAVRYAASRVTVAVRSDGEWAELTVTDDGPGIPAGDLERAFDRFARLDCARSRDEEEPGGAWACRSSGRRPRPTAAPPTWSRPLSAGFRAIVRLPRPVPP